MCFSIEFAQGNELLKSIAREKSSEANYKSYYNLSFKYTFECQQSEGGVYFAYALPFSFT